MITKITNQTIVTMATNIYLMAITMTYVAIVTISMANNYGLLRSSKSPPCDSLASFYAIARRAARPCSGSKAKNCLMEQSLVGKTGTPWSLPMVYRDYLEAN